MRRGVGHYRGVGGPSPDARVELERQTFELILANRASWQKGIETGEIEVLESPETFDRFLSFFEGWSRP